MKKLTLGTVAALALSATFSQAQSFSYSLDAGITLNSAIVIWGTPVTGGFTGNDVVLTSPLSGTGTFTVSGIVSGDPYTVVDNYIDSTGATHVALLADSSTASTLNGADFQTTFGESETNVETAISLVQSGFFSLNGQNLSSNSTTAGLLSYFPTYNVSGPTNPFFGFSSGAQVGTVTSNAVPEPRMFALFAVGAIALLKRRKA